MCGITVYITKSSFSTDDIQNVSHRGPDRTNIITSKIFDYNAYFVFHRLAIIDVSHGHQPFVYEEKTRRVYLLCNGEIYNYKNLIEKYNLNTTSDCHVILDLFLKFGINQTVKELDGEFAFVIVDIDSTGMNIYYCRDRFGIRPLFCHEDESGFYFSSELKGLPFKGKGNQVQPRYVQHIHRDTKNNINRDEYCYYKISNDNKVLDSSKSVYENIRDSFTKSVIDRLNSERDLGALLSGGLDSSLVCAIASRYLKTQGKRLKTFSIGIEDTSPDIQNARKVAEFIDSDHHEIIIPVNVWLYYLDVVPVQIETYDITTIRATLGQYLISAWIRQKTDIKVLLVGDGSDELAGGYRYFYNAPNDEEFNDECKHLLSEIHFYDGLRCDRGISAFGIECRVPFLAHDFVDTYLAIDASERKPISEERIEKYLIRKSFESENLLPHEILFRSKEAFSDGVASEKKSLFEYIAEKVDKKIDDYAPFPSKEAKYYYNVFKNSYPNYDDSLFTGYWLPKWVGEMKEPSARCLTNKKHI